MRVYKKSPIILRLLSKVQPEPNSGCWLWTGAADRNGYGIIWAGKGLPTARAHRVAFEHFRDQIPAGLVIDHLCRTPSCCNPDHMDAVSNAENVRRGKSCALKDRITHCAHGHAYDQENTYINRRGSRICRRCHRDRSRATYRPKDTDKAKCIAACQ